jgi:hypothetical protein
MIAGVGLATALSRFILLGLLVNYAKNEFGFKVKGIGLRSPIFATIVMSAFLLAFNHLINMNIILGIVEILSGIIIYFAVLIATKGITNEDWVLLKSFRKKERLSE